MSLWRTSRRTRQPAVEAFWLGSVPFSMTAPASPDRGVVDQPRRDNVGRAEPM